MSLSNEQRSRLAAAAQERGLDSAKLIAAAEAASNAQPEGGGEPSEGAKPDKTAPTKTDRPLYAYHLPFVTVNEVRTMWLGLGPVAGGNENAAKYAAAQVAPALAKPDDEAA